MLRTVVSSLNRTVVQPNIHLWIQCNENVHSIWCNCLNMLLSEVPCWFRWKCEEQKWIGLNSLDCDRWSELTLLHHLKVLCLDRWWKANVSLSRQIVFQLYGWKLLTKSHFSHGPQNFKRCLSMQPKQLCLCESHKASKELILKKEQLKCRLAFKSSILILAGIFWHKEHVMLALCSFLT